MNATNFYTDNLLGLWVAADLDEPTRYVPFLLQGGLDMPDRAYYVDETPRMEEIRAKHREHIASILRLARGRGRGGEGGRASSSWSGRSRGRTRGARTPRT